MTKSQKKHLRKLATHCYEMEMSEALNQLGQDFMKWKDGGITVWDLSKKINTFHDGTARDLYKFYEVLGDPQNAVARGVSNGFLKMEDIQEDCHPLLERLIEYYEQRKGGTTI